MSYRSRKYYVNESFFRYRNREACAYALGFLFADGCVSPPYRFSWSSRDRCLVELVQRLMEAEHPIERRVRKLDGKRHPYYEMRISSKQMVQDLLDLGCIPRKSKANLHLPPIPNNMRRHFIRGYFDGNGGARIDSNGNLRASFNGSRTLLCEIRRVLRTSTDVGDAQVNKHASIGRLEYSGNMNAKCLRDYMYRGAYHWLTRKRAALFAVDPKYRPRIRRK